MMAWEIKHIFDGDYGCEELQPGEKAKVSVTLVNEKGETKVLSVEDPVSYTHLDVYKRQSSACPRQKNIISKER